MSDLDQVTALGAIDAVLDDLDKQLAKQRARVPAADAAIEVIQGQIDVAKAALKAVKTEERATARAVERYEKRRAQAQRALDSGMGDPAAADRQVQQCSAIIDDLEGTQLEQMEAVEQAAATVATAEADLVQATADRAVDAEQAPPIIEDLSARRAVKQAERDALEPQIHAEIRNRYAILRAKKKTAVSLMQDSTCIPCRRTVPMQDASDVRRGLLKSCRNCGRYLVMSAAE